MPTLDGLLFPVIAVMGLAFLFSTILRVLQESRFKPLALGLLFGGSAVIAMSFPIIYGPNVLIDIRALLIGLAVLYGGPVAGLIALAIGVSYRVALGGVGMPAGLLGMGAAFVIGYIFCRFLVLRFRSPVMADATFGALQTLTILSIFVLPLGLALEVLINFAPGIFVANVLGAACIGFVFRREIAFLEEARALQLFASLDPLTKLLNRRGAEEQVKQLAMGRGVGRVVYYIDVDRFKGINDRHGHAAGDAALSTIAQRLSNAVRGEAIISRQGGDEFLVYVPNFERQGVEVLAERFRHVIANTPFVFEDREIPLSISVGAYWTARALAFEAMRDQADAHLAMAKENGRNRVGVGIDGEVSEDAALFGPAMAAVPASPEREASRR